MRQVIWHPKAKEEISSFSEEVKTKLGYLIYRLQRGENLGMPQSRNVTPVGRGVKELRLQGADGIYRSFYLKIKSGDIIIFHAFKKKTQKTSQKDINQGKKNLKEALKWLKQK